VAGAPAASAGEGSGDAARESLTDGDGSSSGGGGCTLLLLLLLPPLGSDCGVGDAAESGAA
jgi:hypothetical protein